MKYLSLFSGIEAASVAWVPLGWSPVAFAEVEPFPCSVLRAHYPHVPNLGDVTKIARQQIEELGGIDLVCGGFPCQDLSVAGKRKGLMNADGSSTRSGLFFTAMRIAEWARARWVVLENVPGLFSSNQGRDFAAVVGEMAGCEFDVPTGGWENAGVAVGPLGLVEWATLDAQYVRVESHPRAVPQRRRRVFIVRDSGNWANRPPLFLEPEGMRGDPAPRRQARESVAGTLSARTKGGGGLGTDSDLAGGLVSHTLLGKPNCSHAADKETYVTHSLRGEGLDASEDGTGRGTPLVPVQVCPTLRAGGNRTGNVSPSLGASNPTAVAAPYTLAIRGRNGSYDLEYRQDGTANAVLTPNGGRGGIGVGAIATRWTVRRLTVLECERLMGFPDGHTDAIHKGKAPADGPRYKALGNSWAINCARWVGERIALISESACGASTATSA